MASINPNVPSRYIVLESGYSQRGLRSPHKKVAVLEVDWDYPHLPSMISLNARGVRAITREWAPVPSRAQKPSSGIMQARRGAAILAEILNTKMPSLSTQALVTPVNAWVVTVAIMERKLPATPDAAVLYDALKTMDVI